MANIKNIKVGDDKYDIEALHFVAGDLNTPAQWKAYIDSIADLGFDVVVLSAEPAANESNYNTYKNNIILVKDDTSETGSYVEYVMTRSGSSGSYTYAVERIGTTSTDLSEYAKKETKTSGPSTTNTGDKNLGTITTTAALAKSTGTVDITGIKYQKSSAATGKAGSTTTTKNTGGGGGVTISGSNFTFTGADKSVSVVISAATAAAVSAHDYTPAGTITMTHDAIKSISLSASTISTDGPQYVESITHTAASLGGDTTFVKDAIASASLGGTTKFNTDAIKSASLTGTTKFNTDAYKASVNGTTLELTAAGTGTVGISTSAATKESVTISTTAATKGTVTINGGGITPVTRYMKPAGTKASVSGSFAGTKASITHTVTQPTFSGSFNSKNVTGTIGGSQTVKDHTHTYLELQEHTHDISFTATAVTGSASAAMVEHTHDVNLGSHSHSLNSHTHTQQ